MNNRIKSFFVRETHPRRGLMAYEWVVMGYLLATLLYVLVMYHRLPNASSMLTQRVCILGGTLALWGLYRLMPCKALRVVRAGLQVTLLGRWYPDIFEINRIFPNLDHLFASWEQAIFGCQPALLFSQHCSSAFFSELMCLGYSSYYPLVAVVVVYYLFFREKEFERAIYVILGAFFLHYVLFILMPVTGPQFYYEAVGMDQIAEGVFPNLHDYFNYHQDRMTCPGYADGFFYSLVESAHQAGERPVAAFPSSHVSICTVLMILVWRSRKLFFCMLPFAILLFFSTVYIRAHYAIDALAGLMSGALSYWLLTRPGKSGEPGEPGNSGNSGESGK